MNEIIRSLSKINFYKLTFVFSLFFLSFSCSAESEFSKEAKKTSKANSASSRINSSSENNKDILKELDE